MNALQTVIESALEISLLGLAAAIDAAGYAASVGRRGAGGRPGVAAVAFGGAEERAVGAGSGAAAHALGAAQLAQRAEPFRCRVRPLRRRKKWPIGFPPPSRSNLGAARRPAPAPRSAQSRADPTERQLVARDDYVFLAVWIAWVLGFSAGGRRHRGRSTCGFCAACEKLQPAKIGGSLICGSRAASWPACGEPIAIVHCDAFRQPALMGFWRPRLLLPDDIAGLDDEQLRMIMLHELAHVRRHDVAINWLMVLVRAMQWWNPVYWLAASRFASLREQACDAFVIRRMAGEPKASLQRAAAVAGRARGGRQRLAGGVARFDLGFSFVLFSPAGGRPAAARHCDWPP